jgi:hypothetical protein
MICAEEHPSFENICLKLEIERLEWLEVYKRASVIAPDLYGTHEIHRWLFPLAC